MPLNFLVVMRGSVAVAFLAMCVSWGAAQEAVTSLPELGVELPIPDGFQKTTEFPGLKHPDGAGILVLTFPDPIGESIADYSVESLRREGLILLEDVPLKPVEQNRKTVKLSHRDESGNELTKWATLFGNQATTTMVLCEYPSALREKFDEIGKHVVMNARPIGRASLGMEEPIDFKLPESQLLKLAGEAPQTQIYTSDGMLPIKSPAEPLLVAGKSMERTKVGDVADFAEQRLKQTAETEILETELIKPETTDPQWRTCEIVATGRDKNSGIPLVVYQKVFVTPDAYYLVQGLVGAERRDEMLPEFRRIAEGFRTLTKEERIAMLQEYGRQRMRRPDNQMRGFARDAARRVGIPRPSPLDGPTPEQREQIQRIREMARRGEQPRGSLQDLFGEPPQEASPQNHEAARRRGEEVLREMAARRQERRTADRVRDRQSSAPFAVADIVDDRPEEDREVRLGGRRRRGEHVGGQDANDLPPAKLPRPKKPLPALRYDESAIRTSPLVGGDGNERFEELAPPSGLLVGARVVIGDSFGGSVQAIEPIFQVGRKYELSRLHGEAGQNVKLLLAPPGYAVGGVQVGAGLLMDAMRLVYMPVDGKRLNAGDREYSEWVGGSGGGTSECVSDGSLVVGVGGTYEREALMSLRLAYVNPDDVKATSENEEETSEKSAADAASAGDDAAPSGMRRWTSADGKFSVVGRLEDFDGKMATIVKGDGKRAKVPAEKLSAKDQGYLEAMGAK
jgi:hypothetical protein